MKKKIWIVILVVILFLVVPIPAGPFKDGGTKEYKAIAYRIVKWNKHLNIEYMDLDFPEFQHGCFHKTSIYWFPKNFKGQRELYDSEIKAILDREGYIDYLALVNKENKLPDDWEDKLETVTIKNSLGDDVEVEKRAYEAYSKLRDDLASEGIFVELDSARRSVAAQQQIWDDFTVKYGEDYTKRYVAVPGYSEHHTGLALDLYLVIDGVDVYEHEDMVEYPEIWAKIHEKLADHGFILRYLEGKESITGYGYEPWHIRYVRSPELAKLITVQGVTLEEYLGKLPVTDVTPPEE